MFQIHFDQTNKKGVAHKNHLASEDLLLMQEIHKEYLQTIWNLMIHLKTMGKKIRNNL